ncbi:MAG TPA: DMT family transporter [Candidatus Faecivivens stercorigallinarum]|nr:DMT family transporter [Candidatus Faecivivens stercorigallinarum]
MNSYAKGVACILTSAFCFAVMNVCVRMAGDLPSVQKSFFRNLIAAVFALILLLRERQWPKITRRQLPLLILRSVFGTVGILCNFYAVDHLVLSDASMLNKMSPFFAILCSWLVLKEKITPVQGAAVLAAFGGSLLIIRPTLSNMDLFPSLIGLLGGAGAGAAYTMVRKLGQTGINRTMIVLFFSAFSCLVTLPFLVFDYHPMSGTQLAALLGAGLAASGGQFSITAAYCYAPAREISVYDYSQVIFSAFLGFVLFQQIPDQLSIIGYLLICGSGIALFLYHRRQEDCVKR